MKRILRIIGFILVNLFFLLLAVILIILFRLFGSKIHRRVTTFFVPIWSNIFLSILGINVRLKNKQYKTKRQNYFIIGNHLSYLDVVIVGSQFPVLFVGKKEVKKWPLLGTLAWLGGMLFIDRSITGATYRPYVQQIASALREGFHIAIFPEGTSSNGDRVLPFKKTIFSCPVIAQVPILPVSIRYVSVDHEPFGPQNQDVVCWYGNMTFIDHFWRLLNLKRFEVEIIVHPPAIEKPEVDWLKQNGELAKKYHDIIEQGYFQRHNP